MLVSLAPGYETVDWGGMTHVGGGSHGALEAGDSLIPMLTVGFDDGITERREQWKLADAAGLVAEHFGLEQPTGPRPPRPRHEHLRRLPPHPARDQGARELGAAAQVRRVGASGYVVNLAVFAALVEGLGVHHILGAIGAFCVAVTNNFLWNRHWTFDASGGHAGQQAWRFSPSP